MASEQKLPRTDDNQSNATMDTITSGEWTSPLNDNAQPCYCDSDSEHKGETVAHPVTAAPEDRREQVEGTTANEGYGVVTGPPQEGEEGAGIEERKKEEEEGKTTEEKVTCVDTSHQVTNVEVSEGKEEVHVGLLVSVDENDPSEEGGEDQRLQVTGQEEAPKETGDKTDSQVTGGETELQGTDDETGPQVTGEERVTQVTGEERVTQVTGEGTVTQVTGDETVMQMTGKKTVPQVTGEETVPQVKGEEKVPQVTGEETVVEVKETCPQVTYPEKRDSDPQVTDKDTSPDIGENVRSDEERGAQVTDTGVHESPDAQLSHAGKKWIDMLVHTIVTQATGDGVCTGEQDTGAKVQMEAENTRAVVKEEEEHSTVQMTGMETMTGEQVTWQGAGAAEQVYADRQVSTDNTGIALHVSGEELGVQEREDELVDVTATPEQVKEELTGIAKQVEEAATHREDSAGAQVTAIEEEVHKDKSSNLEAGGRVIALGEEADREVTPDLDALPGREGTVDQDRPVACREKEWPSLICTGSEVRTVTAEQGDTQQGSITEKEPSDKTPEMKEREIVEDGHSPTHETPIEREIRQTMEREMTLRQERGISSLIGQPQLVEVRRKTISVEPVAVPGKERQLAGAQMQREIQLETQREQDLVELGKVMGTYDRGSQQELQERKMIFEIMNTEPSDAPIKKKQSEPQLQTKPQEAPQLNISISTNHVLPATETKKGPSYTEANGSNVIIIEHSSLLRRSAQGNTFSSAPAESRRSTPADYSRSTPADSRRSIPAEISRTNSTGSPFPNSVDSPVPPGSPYQLLRSPSPHSLLEREIEEVKERERELRRQRSSIYGRDNNVEEATQKTQENASDIQSVYQPERPNWRKLEVNWPPSKDAAMNGQQVMDSPRTRRQRSALIQSWESGTPNPKDDE
ncbi:uncharacterized protein MISP3 isoform X2 [Rhinoderma darwinii]|uniref:uncharacterized protein MISP3 isoform X2 n=1 Tax=Rhinoderma darwinii TaxID=43563 RepID=UPI003F663C51